MTQKVFAYVGLDNALVKFLSTKENLGDLECIIISSYEDYENILQENLPVFLFDLNFPPQDLEKFFELQEEKEVATLNLALSSKGTWKPDRYIFMYIDRENIQDPRVLISLIKVVLKNKEHYLNILSTMESHTNLVQNVPLGMYRTTQSGEFLFANQELLRILEIPNYETLIRFKAGNFYANLEDRTKWVDRLTREKVVRNFEFALKTFTGKTKIVRNNARGIFQKGHLQYIEGFLEDVTESTKLKEKEARVEEKSLSERLFLLDLYKNRTEYLNNTDEGLKDILKGTSKLLSADRAGIWTTLEGKAFENKLLFDLKEGKFIQDSSFSYRDHQRYLNFLEQGIQICAPNVLRDSRLLELLEHYLIPFGIKAVIDTPIFIGGKLWGILKYEFRNPYELDREDEWFCQIVSFYIANLFETSSAISAREESRRNAEILEASYDEVISLLARIVEERDPYTAGHQKKVALLARAIAKELGLPEERAKEIYVAGMIHDIGKIYVPIEILTKPARLTETEYHIVQVHPAKGYEILNRMNYFKDISEIVFQHHERLNGSGYPKGLKSGEIRFESKILAVADVMEAMLANRPYRPSIAMDDVLNTLEEGKGVLFDPEIVEACIKIFKVKKFRFNGEE